MNSDEILKAIYEEVKDIKIILCGHEERLDGIDARLDGMDARFDGIDARLDGIDARFDGIDARLDGIDARLDGMDTRFDGIDVRLDEMQNQINANGEGIARLENEVSKINLRLENEIAPNIMRVAEGHMDLYRKLSEATKITNEQEMMAIRLNILEREMREVKEQTARLA